MGILGRKSEPFSPKELSGQSESEPSSPKEPSRKPEGEREPSPEGEEELSVTSPSITEKEYLLKF